MPYHDKAGPVHRMGGRETQGWNGNDIRQAGAGTLRAQERVEPVKGAKAHHAGSHFILSEPFYVLLRTRYYNPRYSERFSEP